MEEKDLSLSVLESIKNLYPSVFITGGAERDTDLIARHRSEVFTHLAVRNVPKCEDKELYILLLSYFALVFLEASFQSSGIHLNPSSFAGLKSLAAGSLKVEFSESPEVSLFTSSAFGRMYLRLVEQAGEKMLPFSS